MTFLDGSQTRPGFSIYTAKLLGQQVQDYGVVSVYVWNERLQTHLNVKPP